MHIVLLAPAIGDYSVAYANAIGKRAQVTLIAPARFFSSVAGFVDPSVDLRLLDWPRHRSLRNVPFLFKLLRQIETLCPDIVHFLSEGGGWLNLITPFLHRYPIIATMHDVSYHVGDRQSRRVPRWFADRLVSKSDRVVVHGEGLKLKAEQTYPRLRGRIDLLPHVQLRRYLDIATAREMSRAADARVHILFFGRIYRYKGLDILIRSIALVIPQTPDIRVIIAGEGEEIDAYKALAEQPAFFEFRNRHIPDDEVAQLFTDADIVVLPYIAASQSGVLAIATSFGKPVIVTAVGELGNATIDGQTGLVVPPGDAAALAGAILKLAGNKPLRTQLGNAARAAAEATSSADFVANAALQLYDQVLRSRQPDRVAS